MDGRVLFLLFIFSVNFVAYGEKVVLCYYGSWATYRHGLGKFDVENINADLCTHIMYTFVGIDSQGTVISLDPYLDLSDNYGKNNFRKFNALKQINPKLKTILAVGGWNEGSAKYSIVVANPTLRQNFVQSALKMVLDYGFDGFDVDWEYPNRRDTVHGAADIANFVQLLKELREEFDKHGLLLTAAVAATKDAAALSYNIPVISKYLDYVSLMTYDMYGAWDPVTGHNSPLHKGEGDEGAAKEDLHTVDVSLEYWLNQGCPPEKLVVGLPLYARTFTLTNANVNGVRAPSSGAGLSGPYTVTSGFMGYNELCYKLNTEDWTVKYDSLAKVPYAVRDRNWVTFDDADSITKKVEYALNFNIAGAMVWSIETEDFHGVCGQGDYPILRAIKAALGQNTDVSQSSTTSSTTSTTTSTTSTSTTTTTTTAPTTTTTQSTTEKHESSPEEVIVTTPSPSPSEAPSGSICKEIGFVSDPVDCSTFYMCVQDVDGTLVANKFECPGNTVWDQKNLYCNYDYLVECNL